MQAHDWIELFRTIPEAQHNTLVLTTLSGVDLSIDTIIRTELNYLVFRGRVCGQTDDGRLFFLPYRQIDFLQLNRSLKESEINELLGGTSEGPKSGWTAPAPGSGLHFPVIAPPKSGFSIGVPPGSSPQIVPTTPQVPAAALRPGPPAPRPVPGRAPNVPAAGQPGASIPNVPAAALVPPPAAGAAGANPAAAPRNSILERLRAQRNAILPPRPPAR